MMSKVERWFYITIMSIMLTLAVLASVPASSWYDVKSVTVKDTFVGTDPIIILERKINRPFRASWIVTLRRLNVDGWEEVCSGHGEQDYRMDAKLPVPLRLSWWMGRACSITEPGIYRLNAVWTLQGMVFDREVRVESNRFEVFSVP